MSSSSSSGVLLRSLRSLRSLPPMVNFFLLFFFFLDSYLGYQKQSLSLFCVSLESRVLRNTQPPKDPQKRHFIHKRRRR